MPATLSLVLIECQTKVEYIVPHSHCLHIHTHTQEHAIFIYQNTSQKQCRLGAIFSPFFLGIKTVWSLCLPLIVLCIIELAYSHLCIFFVHRIWVRYEHNRCTPTVEHAISCMQIQTMGKHLILTARFLALSLHFCAHTYTCICELILLCTLTPVCTQLLITITWALAILVNTPEPKSGTSRTEIMSHYSQGSLALAVKTHVCLQPAQKGICNTLTIEGGRGVCTSTWGLDYINRHIQVWNF